MIQQLVLPEGCYLHSVRIVNDNILHSHIVIRTFKPLTKPIAGSLEFFLGSKVRI